MWFRCNSLSCPPGQLAPRGASCPGLSYPHPGYLHPRGASCPGRFILPPTHTGAIIYSDVFNLFAIYCDIYMFFWSYKDVFQRYEYQLFKWFTFVRGVGGKLSRLVYLAPHLGFGLHHNLGIFSCKRCEHYFSQTAMFTSNVQFGYPCPRGGGQAVQAGLSCAPPRIWVKQSHQLILIAP